METRLKIVKTTMELLKEKRFTDIRIEDICRKAEVSVGTYYHHFKSKEEIVNRSYADFDISLEEHFDKVSSLPPLERIHFLIDEQLKYCADNNSNIISKIFQVQLYTDDKYIIDSSRFLYKALNEAVEGALNRKNLSTNLTCSELTDMILRQSRGVIYDWCLNRGSYDLRKTGRADLECLLRGLSSSTI